jgi:hypothetical protein
VKSFANYLFRFKRSKKDMNRNTCLGTSYSERVELGQTSTWYAILNISGMSLMEVMIAGGITSVIGVTIAHVSEYGSKSLKNIQTRQYVANFKAQIKSVIDSSNQCKSLIASPMNPSLTTPQSVVLTTPFGTLSHGTHVGDDLQISTITFTKLSDANPGGLFTVNGTSLWSLSGNLNITFENSTAQKKLTFGAKQLSFTFPMNLTLQNNGNWTVKSCIIESPLHATNFGWTSASQNNPVLCQQIKIDSGQNLTCPEGMYVVDHRQSTSTERVSEPYEVVRNVHDWSPNCHCIPDNIGKSCVIKSHCSSECDADGNARVPRGNDQCRGTCKPISWCGFKGFKSVSQTQYKRVTVQKSTLNVTCCRVQK